MFLAEDPFHWTGERTADSCSAPTRVHHREPQARDGTAEAGRADGADAEGVGADGDPVTEGGVAGAPGGAVGFAEEAAGGIAGVEAEAGLDASMAGGGPFPEVLGEDEVGARALPVLAVWRAARGWGGKWIGGGEDAGVGPYEYAERGRGAGGAEEGVFDELAGVGLRGFERDEVLEGPGIRPGGGVGRGEDVGVVVNGEAAGPIRAGEAGYRHRAGAVGLGERRSAERIARCEEVAAGIAGDAEGGHAG